MLQVQSSVCNMLKTVLCSFSFFFIWPNFVPTHSPHPQPPFSFQNHVSYYLISSPTSSTSFSTNRSLSSLHMCIDANNINWCLHRRESLSLWVWVSLLHIRLSKPIYFFWIYFSLQLNTIPMFINTQMSSSVDGHLGWSHRLATVNNAAINSNAEAPLW